MSTEELAQLLRALTTPNEQHTQFKNQVMQLHAFQQGVLYRGSLEHHEPPLLMDSSATPGHECMNWAEDFVVVHALPPFALRSGQTTIGR